MTTQIDRRRLLAAGGLLGAITLLPSAAFAAAQTDKRLVFLIQRGAADGLAIVPPVGDPALASLRGALRDDAPIPLDGMFGLHPEMQATAGLFAAGEARAFHAVATAYRDRSHFDGQNVLESGAAAPYGLRTGWLGRLLPLLPGENEALALAPAVPLALRGNQQVATYSPNRLPDASQDLLLRLGDLYAADAQLAPMWAEAIKTKELAGDLAGNDGRNGGDLGKLAASLLAPADGARVMMIETGGWDTHSNQKGRLAGQLRGLDRLLAELKAGLGAAWSETLVIVATEFGRTAAVNGTQGTDHGTASAAFLLGGALGKGQPVVADWPGLSHDSLFEGRDLKPTADLGGVISGALGHHYGIDRTALAGLFATA
ncbi:hypothetical protein A6F68_00217 [Tsuneonella dongtanensis]|uniref:DUF1501 domain-containing protein n=1 Tax=Tsuneonella dongtanensis TaxID=692370 RepID=A0A1B2A9D9_9SPHN|nr:DUF1501 domain-containing protein [Tsuneonella dongtanensis]ANY18752.1 hypothetical protein A6F68_00217 [Tsuneonella dongtanensis]